MALFPALSGRAYPQQASAATAIVRVATSSVCSASIKSSLSCTYSQASAGTERAAASRPRLTRVIARTTIAAKGEDADGQAQQQSKGARGGQSPRPGQSRKPVFRQTPGRDKTSVKI